MAKKETKRNTSDTLNALLAKLREDPTKSSIRMASELRMNRQTFWRKKKELEDGGQIWGYTTIFDDSGMGWVYCIVLMKMKVIKEDIAKGAIAAAKTLEHEKKGVILWDAMFLNGEYDVLVSYSAPNIATARRFYELLRGMGEEVLLEKPLMLEMSFAFRKSGKLNPHLERFMELVP